MDKYFRGLYRDKKVLITGHTGFKGTWLSLWLTELGANVIGYSLDVPTQPSLFEAINIKDKITHIIGDVCDEKHLMVVFEEYQPELVFHLAAQPLVRVSYKEPRLTYETNIMGTVHLLECVRKTKGVRVCIIVTTDKCYENKEWLYGYREIDPLGGYDPYSSSKACAEIVTSAYRNSFFNPNDYGKTHNVSLSSVRAGNVIGGGDWAEDRIVPDSIKALSQNKQILLRNPLAIRPWQYVLDPLGGYLTLSALMSKEGHKYSDAYNFGPDNANIITVNELTNLIIQYWGSGNYVQGTLKSLHEAQLLKLDITKAQTLLGWTPVYNIYESIEKTVNWYKSFYEGASKEKMYEVTAEEVWNYMKKISNRLECIGVH
jgi:CDP-glucose 4,6-dehydratase